MQQFGDILNQQYQQERNRQNGVPSPGVPQPQGAPAGGGWTRLDPFEREAQRLNGGVLDPQHAQLLRQEQARQQNFQLPGGAQRSQDLLGGANQASGQFGSVIDRLLGQSRGENLISTEMMRQGMGQALSQQQALAASARPGNQAMAARMAAQNAGRIGMDFTGKSAMAGMQEQQNAANSLAQLLNQREMGMRQMELGNAGQQMQGTMGYANNMNQREIAQMSQPKEPSIFDRILGGIGSVATAGLGMLGKP